MKLMIFLALVSILIGLFVGYLEEKQRKEYTVSYDRLDPEQRTITNMISYDNTEEDNEKYRIEFNRSGAGKYLDGEAVLQGLYLDEVTVTPVVDLEELRLHGWTHYGFNKVTLPETDLDEKQ